MMITKKKQENQERHQYLNEKLFKQLGNSTPQSRSKRKEMIFMEKLENKKSKLYLIVAWFYKLINIDGKQFGFKKDFQTEIGFSQHRSVILDWIYFLEKCEMIKITILQNSADLKLTPTDKFIDLINSLEIKEIISRRYKNG